MFGFGKTKKLDLKLPALEEPPLRASPSVRIMAVANNRSVAIGLIFAAGLSVLFNATFLILLFGRINIEAYVADGSSYGCSPRIVTEVAFAPITDQGTPNKIGLGNLAPIITEIGE